MSDWNIQKSRETYNIPHWSDGYFDINEKGHLEAIPDRNARHGNVDLYELSQEIHEAGLSLPVLVRFTDILSDRVESLHHAFQAAMQENDYDGQYTPVYPIKVNQQRSVVEQILSNNQSNVGLEAGSKPELMAVLALSRNDESIIICNGYKDREYVRLALIGQQLGHRVYIIIEKLSELELIIREAHDLDVTPRLGIRTRLSSLGTGNWQNTGGEKAKFGLSAQQLIDAVERLQTVNMLDCLQLLHFHMGSQIANISDIQRGMREAGRHFSELHEMGVNINVVDVGGGLGVDYEGTRSRSFCSINYSMQEYARNIVHTLQEACSESDLPNPDIITESGRALTAHHAVLITNVIDSELAPNDLHIKMPSTDDPSVLHDLWNTFENLPDTSALEAYHDAAHWLAESRDMYTHGILNLQQRARVEELFYAVCRKIIPMLQASTKAHRDVMDELNEILADKYFCNFSVFQSLPDIWAIQQIFPIAPLHHLDEEPDRHVVIEDITCDSDGRIDRYVNRDGIDTTLPAHSLNDNETYLLGIFMTGAYQEILGDMHNLFGDTDSVNVVMNGDQCELTEASQGDSAEDVLAYVDFKSEELLQKYNHKINAANLSEQLRNSYLQELEAGLRGYTYLED